MTSGSWYKSFAELSKSEMEGFSYKLMIKQRRSGIALVAPHGGGIEPGTSELAIAIAGHTFSYYTFDGIKSAGNELLHITSTRFDEPKCLQLVKSTHTVLTIHGCEGNDPVIHIGGLDVQLIATMRASLQDAEFDARLADGQISANHPMNICNQTLSGKGVQLEISEGLRRSMFKGLTRQERKITTPIYRRFVQVVKDRLSWYSKENPLELGGLFHLF